MTQVADVLVAILRDAWVALAGALVAVIVLAMLAQMLKSVSAMALGANLFVYEAVAALFGLLVLGLYGFLGVPAIVRAAQASIPGSAGSGPIVQISEFSAALIGGIAALRMLKAVFAAAAYAAVGGSGRLAWPTRLLKVEKPSLVWRWQARRYRSLRCFFPTKSICKEDKIMFDPVMTKITELATDAWLFLVGLLVIVAILGALWYILKGTTAVAFGGSNMASSAIIGAIGIIVLVIVAFLVLPELGNLLENMKPAAPFN